MKLPVILVDDEDKILFSYETILQFEGYENIISCRDSRDVLKILSEHGNAKVMLLDLTMPYLSGEELLPQIVEMYPQIPVIVITGINSTEKAVDCIKKGAHDFLVKPVEKDRLVTTVKKAIAFGELQQENAFLKDHLASSQLEFPEAFSEIITQNKTLISIFLYIEAIAKTSNPVLITGKTGTGKELVARAVYNAGGANGQFVPVNVAGLDDNVFADTLFGHVKGAYTGADSNRQGMIEKAAGGTLFLDEIGDLSIISQVKLLRLLQENEYQPLGSDSSKRTNARIVVATNHDLDKLQQEGKFRKDLYYRLCTHHICLPPLRERMEDIPLLLNHFLEDASKNTGMKKPSFPKELIQLLSSYRFPGNIRELKALVNDAVSRHKSGILSMSVFKNYIDKKVISSRTTEKSSPSSGENSVVFGEKLPQLKELPTLLIDEALKRSGGNKSRAAELIGTTRQALSWHLK